MKLDIGDLAQISIGASTAISVLIPVMKSFSANKQRLECIERNIQMLILHDEHLPYRDRLNAGKRYLDLGGNGASKIYYDELAQVYHSLINNKMLEEKL